MGGQFAPEKRWSVYSGKQPKSNLFIGGQFTPESGGQFDRILQLTAMLCLAQCQVICFSIFAALTHVLRSFKQAV